MNKFQYVRAGSAQEAVSLLGEDFNKVKILAGGLDLIGEMKQHLLDPETVVSISGLDELKSIQNSGDKIQIGAAVTLSQIAHHESIRNNYTALAEAASSAGSPQVRHAGTLGGNLCQRPRCWYYRDEAYPCLKKGGNFCYSMSGRNQYHAILGGGPCFMVHPSDCAPALVALGATIRLLGPEGPREMPLEEFFILPSENPKRENVIKSNEIVTELEIPSTGVISTYVKFREKESFDWALSSVAVALKMNGAYCEEARIVLGGVAPTPWRTLKAEEVLRGNELAEDIARQAGEAAVEGAFTLRENKQKVPLTKALVKKAIMRIKAGPSSIESAWLY